MSPIATLFRSRMRHSLETSPTSERDPATRARDAALATASLWLFSGIAVPNRPPIRR